EVIQVLYTGGSNTCMNFYLLSPARPYRRLKFKHAVGVKDGNIRGKPPVLTCKAVKGNLIHSTGKRSDHINGWCYLVGSHNIGVDVQVLRSQRIIFVGNGSTDLHDKSVDG